MKSRGNVHQHLASLRRKGRVTWEDGKAQSIRIIEDGQPTEIDAISPARLEGLIEEAAANLATSIGPAAAADYVAKVLGRLRARAKREETGHSGDVEDPWRTRSQWCREPD
jgi:SOS-response transcriptional repressor LexA